LKKDSNGKVDRKLTKFANSILAQKVQLSSKLRGLDEVHLSTELHLSKYFKT